MPDWSNWSGGVTARPAHRIHAQSQDDLTALMTEAQGPIRALGTGHSFTPIAAVDGGTQVSLDGLDHVTVAGPNMARVGAGGKLGDISAQLHAQGQAFSNMGDINDQALGGALATATHGTGLGFGCYAAMLSELTLIDGTGTLQTLTRDADNDLFRAMAVGVGTGGIVTEAVINTVPSYRLERRRYGIALNDLLEDVSTRMSACRNVEFYYITGSGQALVMESEATAADLVARPPDRDQEGLAQLRLAARLLRWSPALRRFVLGKALAGHTAEHFIEDWHKAYPTDRDGIRFNEAEYHLPLEAGPKALRDVVQVVEKNFPQVYFPMEVRTVGADDLCLSPFYKRDTMSIAVHHEAGQPFDALLQAIEPIFARYDGRPHWGKLHRLKAKDLRALYPEWDIAIEARKELDPENRLVTPYIAALLGL